jgi:hypothetical protein
MEPKIVGENIQDTVGKHNSDLDKSIERIDKSMMYEDLSTIIVCPTRGLFPTRVVQSWMKLMRPMNQLVAGPIFAEAMKVDDAYNSLFKYILDNPYLSKFKYVLTIEEDNIPPADGLLKLYEGMKDYDVVGGLYWGKSDNGFPMIFGDPSKGILDAAPQTPKKNTLHECNALGMGFNLFKLDMFKQIEYPWFKTVQEVTDLGDELHLTQDFYFYRKAAEKGFKFACNTNILVGHYSLKEDKVY